MSLFMIPRRCADRPLGVLIVVVALAGCAGSATTAPSPTPVPNPTPTASTSAPSAAPTATPIPTLRTAFDLPPYAELVKLFDYDAKEPLGYTVTSEKHEDGATTYDITYLSGGYSLPAKLVVPDGKGPFPVVLYAAGYQAWPSFFVPEMVAFAKEGYAGLAIEEWARRLELWGSLDTTVDIEAYAHYVVDLRRGLDLLGTLPTIDAKRIGFAGHSLGCGVGSILSGIETRIRAYALMACGGYLTEPAVSFCGDACYTATAAEWSKYQERLAVLNPANYIGRGGGAAFLFQASKGDTLALAPNVEALVAAAPEPKRLRWYGQSAEDGAGGHGLGCVLFDSCDPTLPAFADHRAWLKEHV